MGKKILDSKILYVVLSILLSLAAWLFVTSRDENRENRPFTNLPVNFSGVEMLEDRELMIVNPNVTASIRVRATPLILATLNETPPKLNASVSNINMEGRHTVNYTVELPSGVSQNDVEITYGTGGSAVIVEVARALSRKVRIEGEFKGSVAEGYLAGDKDDFRFDPAEITISGRADLVNQVSHAKVTITRENLTETVSESLPFQLIGASGDPLEGLDVTCDVDAIYTVFPIKATAEIPLTIKVIEGGGLKERDVSINKSVDSIVVAGSREAVDALVGQGDIILTTIDLAELDDETVENGSERTIPIPLDDRLENVSGITEVKVTLKVNKRVETRTFEVTSRISTINAPEGWTPAVVTKMLPVRVRGTRALLDELTEESIRVVADLRDVSQTAGQYTVEASIYLDGPGTVTDVGVVNPNSYSIVVSLSRDG